jgi:glycerol uptake facilitator-like aquaporin
MNRFTAEFLGTFFLCLFVMMGNGWSTALGLAALIWALGPVSRAYFNPAITLSQRLRGTITTGWALLYVAAQFLAAGAAALASALMIGYNAERAESSPMGVPDAWVAALGAELLGTFLIALVILGVANSRRTAGNSYAALAIGGAVYGASAALGNFSAIFNPAVTASSALHDLFASLRAEQGVGKAFAMELIRFGKFAPWAVCLIATQLVAALLANACFRVTHPEDR